MPTYAVFINIDVLAEDLDQFQYSLNVYLLSRSRKFLHFPPGEIEKDEGSNGGMTIADWISATRAEVFARVGDEIALICLLLVT